ncbi:iron-containing redox enzyme family protein [Candidatus Uabimicrobium sp. HlEnr_7]|uniref:iron-containing redox enzyme family protein n=1 Tax=Candidatus Uabimicrobium helgolandensis TaxID=3095367 RepID=UPI0035592B3F
MQLQKPSENFQTIFFNKEYDLVTYKNKRTRELYYYLMNIDEYIDVLPSAEKIVLDCLQKGEQHNTLSYENRSEIIDYLHCFRQQQQDLPQPSLSDEMVNFVLQQFAPQALIDGAWLNNIGSIVHCHTEISALLFKIYSFKLGDFQPEYNHFYLYKEILQKMSVIVPDIRSFAYITQPQIIDSSFTIPVYYLAISQFPRKFLPEIVGITLAHFFAGFDQFYLPFEKSLYFERAPFYQNDKRHNKTIENIVSQLCQGQNQDIALQNWQRMWNGFYSVETLSKHWKEQITNHLNQTSTTIEEKVIDIISQKAPYSRGHHRETLVGDKTLPEWFDGEKFDITAFLKAFANSPFVDRNEPEKSLLFTRLIAFGGPMFRVFTDREIEILQKWVASLPQKASTSQKVVCPFYQSKESLQRKPSSPSKVRNIRDLFYYLVNVDLFPTTRHSAKLYVEKSLKKTRNYMPFFPKKYHLFNYSHDAFSERIHQIYESQIEAYKPFVKPRFSREFYTDWFMHQLAPLVLVDGCWLQNVAKPGTSHSQIATYLFNTFSDEIGNGETEWNHANVYRKLLESENAQLPHFNTKEFAYHSQIEKASFHLPTLQLSISQFPKTYQPELIGLNLAIEMGGLGWEYMTLVDELTYWDIDPYIVSLHISIDNMATGHTAWAMESVQIYLDQILALQGRDEVQKHWKRIWTGFLSYKVMRIPLMRSVVKQAIKDVACKSLGIRKKSREK